MEENIISNTLNSKELHKLSKSEKSKTLSENEARKKYHWFFYREIR